MDERTPKLLMTGPGPLRPRFVGRCPVCRGGRLARSSACLQCDRIAELEPPPPRDRATDRTPRPAGPRLEAELEAIREEAAILAEELVGFVVEVRVAGMFGPADDAPAWGRLDWLLAWAEAHHEQVRRAARKVFAMADQHERTRRKPIADRHVELLRGVADLAAAIDEAADELAEFLGERAGMN